LEVVRERGAGPARNGGVAAARGQWLAFTDSDCVPEPNWITEGLAALAEFDIVGGRVKVSVQDERAVSPTEAFEKLFAFDFESYIRDKGFTGSGNMFVSRKTFDAVGGFGSGVSEDVDWSHRATAMGYRLGYAPAAVVSHPARRDWVELRTKWSRINRESYALQARTRAGRVRWLLRALLLPASAVAHSPRVLNPRNGLPVTDRIKALGMLYRVRTWRLFDAIRVAVGR
jgi:GT2 family glycosyltransferase